MALAQELCNVVVPPEEYIICVGEEAHEMFFLIHGFADVIARGGKWVTTLKKVGLLAAPQGPCTPCGRRMLRV